MIVLKNYTSYKFAMHVKLYKIAVLDMYIHGKSVEVEYQALNLYLYCYRQ